MRVYFLILLVMILFITGCISKTTGNVVIEDAKEQLDEEQKLVEEEKETTIVQEVEEENITEEVEEETDITGEVANETNATTTGNIVSMENLEFVPKILTIKEGTTVIWKHNDKYVDNMKHMIRIYPGGTASPYMFYGDSFNYTFNKVGEYTIVNVIYVKKDVKGKIFVE